jgi:hypothetical protein
MRKRSAGQGGKGASICNMDPNSQNLLPPACD